MVSKVNWADYLTIASLILAATFAMISIVMRS